MLLRHEIPAGKSPASHWDLMFDTGDLLLTFRLMRLSEHPPESLAAERLPDHRRVYLSYQGEISRGRGRVRRVASGEYQVVDRCEATLRLALRSPELNAEIEWEDCEVDATTQLRVHAWRQTEVDSH